MVMPPKLTETLLTDVCEKVRTGSTVRAALRSEGVTGSQTLARWRQRALERPGSIYGRFVQELLKAEADRTVTLASVVGNAATTGRTQTTTVVRQRRNGDGQLEVVEQQVTRVQYAPDAALALRLLERLDQDYVPRREDDITVSTMPREMAARSLAEKLRIAQGGDPDDASATFLAPQDEEFRELMG